METSYMSDILHFCGAHYKAGMTGAQAFLGL